MCGRFALGVGADDLVHNVQQHYFAPPPPHNAGHQPDPANDEGAGDEEGGGDDEAWNAAHGAPEQQQADEAGAAGEQGSDQCVNAHVQWASLEAKTQFRPRHNVAPTTRVPVLRRSLKDPNTLEFDLLRWGLIPHWYSSPPDSGLTTINAQCESVFEGTPAWRGPRENKRCVVIAQGFYEWLTKGKDKVPHFVKRKDGKMMVFGAYDPVTSYTILTVPVNKQLRFLHTRMPAILSSAAEIALWLSARPWGPDLKAIVHPFEGELECYAVDKGVGKAGNESEDFIKPVAQKKGSLDSLFAKQTAAASSGSKVKPSSSPAKPAASSPARRPKKDEDEEREPAAFNADEGSPARLEKVEEELAASSAPSTAGSAKKRMRSSSVEVLNLAGESESDGTAEGDGERRSTGKGKRVKKEGGEKARPKKQGKGKKTKADEEGNEALTDFFTVARE